MKAIYALLILLIPFVGFGQNKILSFNDFTSKIEIYKINNDSSSFKLFLENEINNGRHLRFESNNLSGDSDFIRFSEAISDLNAYSSRFSNELVFNYMDNSFKKNLDLTNKIINLKRLTKLIIDIKEKSNYNNKYVINCLDINEEQWYLNYSTNFINDLENVQNVSYSFDNCDLSNTLNNNSLFDIFEFKSVNYKLSEVKKYSPVLEGKKAKSEETGKMFVPKLDFRYPDNIAVDIQEYRTVFYEYYVSFALVSSALFDANGEINNIFKENKFYIKEDITFKNGIIDDYFAVDKEENAINIEFNNVGQIENYFISTRRSNNESLISSYENFDGETVIFNFYDIFNIDTNILEKDFVLTTYYIDSEIGINNQLTNRIDSINENKKFYHKQKIGYYNNEYINRIKPIQPLDFNYKNLYFNNPMIDFDIYEGIKLGKPHLFKNQHPFKDSLNDFNYLKRKNNRIHWMDEEMSINWFLDKLEKGNKPHYLQYQYRIFGADYYQKKKSKEIIETNNKVFIITPNTFFNSNIQGGENGGKRDYFLVQVKPNLEYYYYSTYFGDYTSLGSDIYCRIFDEKIQINFSEKYSYKEYSRPKLQSSFNLYKNLNFTKIISEELVNEYTNDNYEFAEYFERIESKKKKEQQKKDEKILLNEYECVKFILEKINYKLLIDELEVISKKNNPSKYFSERINLKNPINSTNIFISTSDLKKIDELKNCTCFSKSVERKNFEDISKFYNEYFYDGDINQMNVKFDKKLKIPVSELNLNILNLQLSFITMDNEILNEHKKFLQNNAKLINKIRKKVIKKGFKNLIDKEYDFYKFISDYEDLHNNFYLKDFNLNKNNFLYKRQNISNSDFDFIKISEDKRFSFRCSDYDKIELNLKFLIYLNNLLIDECFKSSDLINYFLEIENNIGGNNYETRKFLENSKCFDCIF
tara:strand:- start:52 stop:2838 length:2787 start_codon:yes stop_codon:yes gene_type:complete